MFFSCGKCGLEYPISGLQYKCSCGGLFDLKKEPGEKIKTTVSLGEIRTPLLKRNLNGVDFSLKLDYFSPTGSFKDRGAFTLINKIKELGIKEVVEDSSGNAGAAIAAYCAAAGIKCSIYLPEVTSEGKIKQIRAYGAKIEKIAGSRDDVARAVKEAAQKTYYASHVYNPLFFEGTKSIVPEIIEQEGMPESVVVPVGNGTMLLGVYKGFSETGSLPKIIAVQSEHCAPIYEKFKGIPKSIPTPTAAEGIAIGTPERIDEIISAVEKSRGDFITVSDEEVLRAKDKLALTGIYCEPTSGVAVAGAMKYFKGNSDAVKIVVPVTGSGLKNKFSRQK